MIVIYATPSYFKWLPLFIDSYRATNGNDEKIWINLRSDGDDSVIDDIGFKTNVHLRIKPFNLKDMADKYKVPLNLLKESYADIVSGTKSGKHRLAMNMFADDDRIKCLKDTIDTTDEPYYMAFDCDCIFRADISDLSMKATDGGDVGLLDRFRPYKDDFSGMPFKHPTECKIPDGKIALGFLSIKHSPGGQQFIDRYCQLIDSRSMLARGGLKWGQYCLYWTFYEFITSNDNQVKFWREKPSFMYMDGNRDKSPTSKIWYFRTKKKDNDYQQAKAEVDRLLRRKHE